MTAWVDCHSTSGYLGGYSADMGVYAGPWPIMFPPNGSPDSDGANTVEFYVMLPNPSDTTDVTIAGDGSYDSYIYGTGVAPSDPAAPVWADTYWFNDYVGPTLTDSPVPPVLQSGAHLYVTVYSHSGTPPTETPESLVPNTYGGSNAKEWTDATLSSMQSASTVTGPLDYRLGVGTSKQAVGILNYAQHETATGYTNNAEWAADFATTPPGPYELSDPPFPSFDLRTQQSAIMTDLDSHYPGTDSWTGVSVTILESHGQKDAYDPGGGSGIKAENGPTVNGLLGQYMHSVRYLIPPTKEPAFFDTGFNTVWTEPPWNNDFPDWLPAADTTGTFTDDSPGLSITGDCLTQAEDQGGVLPTPPTTTPSSVPTQTINVYARQAPWIAPSELSPTGPVDSSTLTLVGTFDVTWDFSTGLVSGPSNVDLSLASLGITPDGSGNLLIEVIFEPAAWQNGVDLLDLPEPDAGGLANGALIKYTYEYQLGLDLAADGESSSGHWFPYEINFPEYQYWIPGELVASAGVLHGAWGIPMFA